VIRIHKGPVPPTLQQNAAAWTEELLATLNGGQEVPREMWNRYNTSDVKQQAIADSHSKCAYCESKVTHVSFGDLEHMRPKKRFPSSAYDWNNLVLVCSRCNNKKRELYDEAVPPVDPVVEDPSAFLIAHGDWIWPTPGHQHDRGAETISLVGLNRVELVECRKRRCEKIRLLVNSLKRVAGQAAKAAVLEQLREELSNSGEFSFVSRAAARALAVDPFADQAPAA
jgi:uncharacterized protein (TIGR02646 family)